MQDLPEEKPTAEKASSLWSLDPADRGFFVDRVIDLYVVILTAVALPLWLLSMAVLLVLCLVTLPFRWARWLADAIGNGRSGYHHPVHDDAAAWLQVLLFAAAAGLVTLAGFSVMSVVGAALLILCPVALWYSRRLSRPNYS